jgi:hypothetical protein
MVWKAHGLYQTSIHPSPPKSPFPFLYKLPRTPQLLPAEVNLLLPSMLWADFLFPLFYNLLQVDFATSIHLLDSHYFINLILDLASLRCCIASLLLIEIKYLIEEKFLDQN